MAIILEQTNNIGILFEGLFSCLVKAIVDNNTALIKECKSFIINNIYKSPVLSKELVLYNNIIESTFSNQDICKTYIQETFKEYVGKKDVTTEISLLTKKLQEHNEMAKCVAEAMKISATKPLFESISRLITIRRKNTKTLQESKEYYTLLDNFTNEQVKRYNVIKEQESKEVVKNKIPYSVYKQAVRIFNERYVGKFSPAINEIIYEYLHFKKPEKFRMFLNKKLKQTLQEANTIKKSGLQVEHLDTLINNIKGCQQELQEAHFTQAKDGIIYSFVNEISQYIDVVDDIKELTQ